MREVVMDTETTGLDFKNGDRLIELGCVEIVNRIPTGVEYHTFINPDGRKVHPDAVAVHGISDAFLHNKPFFKDIIGSFLEFIGVSPLVIHNANFDIGFINSELTSLEMVPITMDRVIDTLALARRKHPGGPNSLDALCRRYGINNSKRNKHSAIVDSLLLAEVYVELLGERQAVLGFGEENDNFSRSRTLNKLYFEKKTRPRPLLNRLSEEDIKKHSDFIETLGVSALWKTRL